MRVYLSDQARKFPLHLKRLEQASVMPYELVELREQINTIPIETNKPLTDLDMVFLFNYQIFPGHIMSYLGQWQTEHRVMRVGDTIVQQAFIPPIKQLSQKVIFGVRINNIIREANRIGFTYETLERHVERGISTFTIEQADSNGVIFKIHTFSKPGNLLTRMLGPVFSVPYQAYCTKRALAHVKEQLENVQ